MFNISDQISVTKLSSSDQTEEVRTKEGIWLQDSKKLLEYGPRIKAVDVSRSKKSRDITTT